MVESHQPCPECLQLILRWRFVKRVRLNLVYVCNKVHVCDLYDCHPSLDLPNEIEDGEHDEWHIVGYKGGRVPPTFEEYLPSTEL